jgi:RNA polymerase sigma-70 factor (ECF subfamily)
LSAEQIQIWVQKISESDREAFDKLFRLLYPRLVRYSYKYVHNKASAADIVQDAFIALWKKRSRLDPQRSVKAYLYQTVRNRSLNYLRDHSNETVGLESLNDSGMRTKANTKQQSESDERMDLLKNWITDLPERQREAFELSRFEGLDHDEIASVMNVSSNTVNNHIVAALKRLRDRYNVYLKEKKISYD